MMGSFALLEMDGGSIVLVHSPSEAQEEEGINAVSAAALLPSGSYMVHSQIDSKNGAVYRSSCSFYWAVFITSPRSLTLDRCAVIWPHLTYQHELTTSTILTTATNL